MPPRGDRLEALYAITLTLGLRRGEALGLSWSDIDLDSGRGPRAPSASSGTDPDRAARGWRTTHAPRPSGPEDEALTEDAPPDAGTRRAASGASSPAGPGATGRRTGVAGFGSRLHDQEGHTDRPRQLRPLLPPAMRPSRPRALDTSRAAPLRRLDHARPGHAAVGRLRGARPRLGGHHQGRLRAPHRRREAGGDRGDHRRAIPQTGHGTELKPPRCRDLSSHQYALQLYF